jgi:hypothetical protein
MAVTRRCLLLAAATVPALIVARHGAELAGDAIAGAVRSARPAATGTSATRCAQCGSADHTMLDPVCVLAPRVPG